MINNQEKFEQQSFRKSYIRSQHSVAKDELKLVQSWSVSERDFLLELISIQYGSGPIRWRHVQQYFPERTKLQIKQYYYNVLRGPQAFSLKSHDNQLLFLRYFVSGFDFDSIKQYYPTITRQLSQQLVAVRRFTEEIMGCAPFIFGFQGDQKVEIDKKCLDSTEEMFLFVQDKRDFIVQWVETLPQEHKARAREQLTLLSEEKVRTGLRQVSGMRKK